MFLALTLNRIYADQQERDDSLLLAQLLRRDFTGLPARLRKVFPRTKTLPERYVDWVAHWADELTGMYARPVVRVFRWPAKVADQVAASVAAARVYEDCAFDLWAHETHRSALCQQSILCAAWPDGPGRVRLESLERWRYQVMPRDPMRADDLRGATVRLAVPIATSSDMVSYLEATITEQVAYVEIPGKGRYGLLAPDGSNPLGRLPFVALHLETPDPGRFNAPLNSPVLNAALALCEQSTDETIIARHQAYAQRYISGAGAQQMAEQAKVGPEQWMVLTPLEDGPLPTVGIAQGQLQLDQLSRWREASIRERCAFASVSPDAFVHTNTAATAEARRMRMQERADMQRRVQPRFERWEREMARLVFDVASLGSATRYPTPDDVAVTWTDWEIPSDPQAEAQATQAEIDMGLTTASRKIAEREGVPFALARQRVQANLDETRSLAEPVDKAASVDETAIGALADPSSPVVTLPSLALNGAQVQSALGIVQQVAAGALPRESGVQMLMGFFSLSSDLAEAMMGEVGKSFVPAAAPAPVAPAFGGP